MKFDPDRPHPATVADFALLEARPGAILRYWRLMVDTTACLKSLQQSGKLEPGMSWFEVDSAPAALSLLGRFPDGPEAEALFFFHDVSRPDRQSRARAPTEAEKRLMWGTARPEAPAQRALRMWRRVRSRLNGRG